MMAPCSQSGVLVRRFFPLLMAASLVTACGSDSGSAGTTSLSGVSAATGVPEPEIPETTELRTFPNNGDCEYMNMQVNPPVDDATGALTSSPFDLSTIRMFINGAEGNGTDPRFSYVQIANEDDRVPIYAPAPMLLVKMRLKDGFVQGSTRENGDWDLTFLVSCDLQIRINHITEPDARILAAYGYGSEPGTTWNEAGEKTDNEEMMVPVTEVRLEAGDLIGYTQGTRASNFDYVVAIDNITVCPWEQFTEPLRSELLAKLGPPPDRPTAGPVAGWACTGYGGDV